MDTAIDFASKAQPELAYALMLVPERELDMLGTYKFHYCRFHNA